MVKVAVLELDSFVVINNALLNDQDRLSLTLLYQPIIGSLSVGLYLALWGYLGKDKIASDGNTHYDLIQNMQVTLEDIMESREKLEAIGLMKTYYQKGEVNRYVYELYSPLSSNQFLSNPILNTALYNNVNKKEYKRIINEFHIPKFDLEGYEDITCSFGDVYNFLASDQVDMRNIKKAKYLNLSFEPTIEFHEMLSLIPEEQLNYRSISKEMQQMIYQLAFIYELDNNTMAQLITDSLEDRKIDMELLKEKCRKFYRFENKGKDPMILYRNQPLCLRQNRIENDLRSEMINQFETISPLEYLKIRQDVAQITPSDKLLLEYLLIDQEMKPGVVNVLLDYVLQINDNKLVKPFVEQIAAQWKRSKIETVSDAIEIAKKENGKKKEKKVSKKETKVPSWFDQNIEEVLLTDEELEAFENELKGVNHETRSR